jgi:hypothetical protein
MYEMKKNRDDKCVPYIKERGTLNGKCVPSISGKGILQINMFPTFLTFMRYRGSLMIEMFLVREKE